MSSSDNRTRARNGAHRIASDEPPVPSTQARLMLPADRHLRRAPGCLVSAGVVASPQLAWPSTVTPVPWPRATSSMANR